MKLLVVRGNSHLSKISARTLTVLVAVTEAQIDGPLAANMADVRREIASMDETAFLQSMHALHTYGLVESEVWRHGWKVWATRDGWATVMESEG